MSRPKDLPAALQNWANANYGAGPAWAGTAQRQAPAGTAFTPGVSLPAENQNYCFGNVFDAAQGALNAVGEMPALNFGAAVAPVVSLASVAWSDIDQAWYAVLFTVGTVNLWRSLDYGKTWISNASFAANVFQDIAFDTAGNAVVIEGVGGVYSGLYNGWSATNPFTWTLTGGATATLAISNVGYESVSTKWFVLGNLSGSGMRGYTSTNRIAWTAVALPGTWGTTQPTQLGVGVGNGVLVACYVDASNNVRTTRSADGGTTWTNDQAITVNGSIAASFITRPVWSATDSLWYFAIGMTSTFRTQVMSSPDGITWTTAAALIANTCAFTGLACLGSLLVASNNDGRVYASWNKGANWWRCGFTTTSQNQIRAGGNGFLVWGGSTGNCSPSTRFGLPVTAA